MATLLLPQAQTPLPARRFALLYRPSFAPVELSLSPSLRASMPLREEAQA